MPVVSTAVGTLASDVTNRARAILNDMLNGNPAGDIFADNLPSTIQFLNSGIDYLSNKFINTSLEFNTNEVILYGLPITSTPQDPNSRVTVSYTGCNNGSENFVTPALPTDLIIPLKIWARQSGTIAPFIEISGAADGLGPRGINVFQRVQWDWYQNLLIVNGPFVPLDLRIRYIVPIPLVSNTSQYIPVQNAVEPLAYLCAYKYEQSVGNPLAQTFKDAADLAISSIVDRTQRRKERIVYRRRWRG